MSTCKNCEHYHAHDPEKLAKLTEWDRQDRKDGACRFPLTELNRLRLPSWVGYDNYVYDCEGEWCECFTEKGEVTR